MDGGTSDVELLLASARQEISALRTDPRFEEPDPKDGKRGAALYRHLLDLVEASELRMATPPDPGASVGACEAFARSLRESISVLREAHRAILWLAATKSPNVNLGSLYMSEEYAEILVGSDVDLVVVPDVEFMYSTVSWPFSPTIDTTPGFTRKTDRRPIIINYPLSDSDRLLLHPLFAHELGHSTVHKFDLLERFATDVFADGAFAAALDAEVSSLSQGMYAGTTDVKIRQTLRSWIQQWVTELLCDHLAVETTGPAYLWAAAAFLLPLNRSEPSPTHPPTTVRIKLILEHLAAKGWLEFYEQAAPGVASLLAEAAADAERQIDQPWEFLRRETLSRGQWFRDAAAGRVGSRDLGPAAADQAREAAELLRRLILPVGPDLDPLAPRSILLGGWLDGIRRHGDSSEGLLEAQSDRRLQDLIGKAIEMSTVSATWSTT